MRLLFLTAAVALAQNATYPVKPVPFTAVHFHDDFWAPRIELNRTATIPAAFSQLEKAGDFDNFESARPSFFAANLSPTRRCLKTPTTIATFSR